MLESIPHLNNGTSETANTILLLGEEQLHVDATEALYRNGSSRALRSRGLNSAVVL